MFTEKRIRAEFNKLCLLLREDEESRLAAVREEEESRLAAVREEEDQKGKVVMSEMEKIQEETSSLSIDAVEKELQQEDTSEGLQSRARDQCSQSEPVLPVTTRDGPSQNQRRSQWY